MTPWSLPPKARRRPPPSLVLQLVVGALAMAFFLWGQEAVGLATMPDRLTPKASEVSEFPVSVLVTLPDDAKRFHTSQLRILGAYGGRDADGRHRLIRLSENEFYALARKVWITRVDVDAR